MSNHTKRNQRVAGSTNTSLQRNPPHGFCAEEIRKKCMNAIFPLCHCQWRHLKHCLWMFAQTLLNVHVPFHGRGVKFGLFFFLFILKCRKFVWKITVLFVVADSQHPVLFWSTSGFVFYADPVCHNLLNCRVKYSLCLTFGILKNNFISIFAPNHPFTLWCYLCTGKLGTSSLGPSSFILPALGVFYSQ